MFLHLSVSRSVNLGGGSALEGGSASIKGLHPGGSASRGRGVNERAVRMLLEWILGSFFARNTSYKSKLDTFHLV